MGEHIEPAYLALTWLPSSAVVRLSWAGLADHESTLVAFRWSVCVCGTASCVVNDRAAPPNATYAVDDLAARGQSLFEGVSYCGFVLAINGVGLTSESETAPTRLDLTPPDRVSYLMALM